jgi:hydroxymethylglutaryl-CoA lyase
MKVTVYEVGPRDGLQYLEHIIDTDDKKNLINALYRAGIENIEEVSFAHPKRLPQMADAEKVFSGFGAGLVMNKRGYDRAVKTGVEKINIVFSPCETFNVNNMGKTRQEIVLMYKTFMDKVPKENVRVYISMAFGSPHSGIVKPQTMLSCLRDAKMFGNTVVFADTVGVASEQEVALWAEKGDEQRALALVRSGLFNGIKQFDSSINGLGGCPFTEGSGANLSTQTLVRHLNAWGFDCGLQEEDLADAARIARSLTNVLLS